MSFNLPESNNYQRGSIPGSERSTKKKVLIVLGLALLVAGCYVFFFAPIDPNSDWHSVRNLALFPGVILLALGVYGKKKKNS